MHERYRVRFGFVLPEMALKVWWFEYHPHGDEVPFRVGASVDLDGMRAEVSVVVTGKAILAARDSDEFSRRRS